MMKKPITATILFSDLMNSTELAKNLSLVEYDDMLLDFQNTMHAVVSDHLSRYGYTACGVDAEWSIVGDEVKVFLYSGNLNYDIRNALLIAMKLKLAWLVSEFNRKILHEQRPVSQIGVGINWGKVIKAVRPWRSSTGIPQPNIEGYTINLTKRIESASRDGTISKIMVGDRIHKSCRHNSRINVRFGQPHDLVCKGFTQGMRVYELQSFVNFEIIRSMPPAMQNGLLEKMEEAAAVCFQEQWLYWLLLRAYISHISLNGDSTDVEEKAITFGHHIQHELHNNPTLYNMLGWVYAYGKKVRNLETALHYFEQCISLDPGNQSALLHRARILDKMGSTMVRHAYQRVLIHNTKHPEARKKIRQHALPA